MFADFFKQCFTEKVNTSADLKLRLSELKVNALTTRPPPPCTDLKVSPRLGSCKDADWSLAHVDPESIPCCLHLKRI